MSKKSDVPSIEIPVSRRKVRLLVMGSLGFVALGVWLVTTAGSATGSDALIRYLVGAASIVFFGLCGLIAMGQCLRSGPGLVINSEGILDHVSATKLGLIPWSDVVEISESSVQSQRFLTLTLSDPELYLERLRGLPRFVANANLKYYGSPAHIAASPLQIPFEELYEQVLSAHEAYTPGRGLIQRALSRGARPLMATLFPP